jgi:chromosome segregation ATPase
MNETMNDSKALFDYWYDRVQLTNYDLIAAPEHIETFRLRHECTNYDELRVSAEVNQLAAAERSRVIAIIKYECTAKVLQFRAGRLRDRANQLEHSWHELEQERSKLFRLIKALQEQLFGRDKDLKRLEARITILETENEALRAEAENNKAEAELQAELAELQKKYAEAVKRRQELAKNNQRLGGKVAHTQRYKQQRDEARATVTQLQADIAVLKADNQKLQAENQALRQALEQLQPLTNS